MLHHSPTATLLVAAVLLPALFRQCEQVSQVRDQVNSCTSVFPEGTVDLSPLDALRVNKSAQPRFPQFATMPIAGVPYNLAYNPCTGFKCNSDLEAAVCALDTFNLGFRYDMASQPSSAMSMINKTVQIRYASSDKAQGRNFITVIDLVCVPDSADSTLKNVELSANNELKFQLNSMYCCLIPHPTPPGGWSPGDYIVLFFFLAAFLYFAGFLVINSCFLKRTGLDLLPHRHVWIYLGLLVKDGSVFTVSTIRGKWAQRTGYTQI